MHVIIWNIITTQCKFFWNYFHRNKLEESIHRHSLTRIFIKNASLGLNLQWMFINSDMCWHCDVVLFHFLAMSRDGDIFKGKKDNSPYYKLDVMLFWYLHCYNVGVLKEYKSQIRSICNTFIYCVFDELISIRVTTV